jgi:hypothetical protein
LIRSLVDTTGQENLSWSTAPTPSHVPKKLMPLRWSSRCTLDDWLHTVKLKAMPLIQVMVNRVLIPFIALPSYQGRVPAPG